MGQAISSVFYEYPMILRSIKLSTIQALALIPLIMNLFLLLVDSFDSSLSMLLSLTYPFLYK